MGDESEAETAGGVPDRPTNRPEELHQVEFGPGGLDASWCFFSRVRCLRATKSPRALKNGLMIEIRLTSIEKLNDSIRNNPITSIEAQSVY
jgi:hypothetical protein